MIAIGVTGSRGDELDPVLDLSHSGIYTHIGALNAIAHNTNLGESNNNKKFIKCIKVIRFNL